MCQPQSRAFWTHRKNVLINVYDRFSTRATSSANLLGQDKPHTPERCARPGAGTASAKLCWRTRTAVSSDRQYTPSVRVDGYPVRVFLLPSSARKSLITSVKSRPSNCNCGSIGRLAADTSSTDKGFDGSRAHEFMEGPEVESSIGPGLRGLAVVTQRSYQLGGAALFPR